MLIGHSNVILNNLNSPFLLHTFMFQGDVFARLQETERISLTLIFFFFITPAVSPQPGGLTEALSAGKKGGGGVQKD